MERGSPGVVLRRNGLDAFFTASRAGASLRRDIGRFVAAIDRLSPRARKTWLHWKIVRQENWQHGWKRFIKPRRVGRTFWVTPPWLEPPKFRRRRVITIEPGMAFGTGTHATTRGCMEFLEVIADKLAGRKFSALDVGTGSGILAIALAHLGAREIRAIDNDAVALQVARDNLRVNAVEDRVRLSGTGLGDLKRRFDVVAANLTAETILELAADLQKVVAPQGFLVLSGILHQRHGAVIRLFAGEFRVIRRKRSREWMSLLLQRK